MTFRHLIQLNRHDPERGIYGDCYRTAIAMCLGCAQEDVPHFCDGEENDWRAERDDWLAARGLCAIELPWVDIDHALEQARLSFGNAAVTISGRSPRGTLHECVIFQGSLFDPHPDGGGIVAPHDDGLFWMHFFTRDAA